MKKYVIIAGVNGAGKSTLYQSYGELKTVKSSILGGCRRAFASLVQHFENS